MMPHLGVLAAVHPQAAREVFVHDCLVNVGHAIAPVWKRQGLAQGEVARVFVDGRQLQPVRAGSIAVVELEVGRRYDLRVEPRGKAVDVGAGPGKVVEKEIEGGCVGLILDGRNRPIEMPRGKAARAFQERVFREVGLI